MKVGFIGAQGTGKTSIADAFVKDEQAVLRNWKFVPSTARLAMAEGYQLNRDADQLGQLLTTVSRIVAEYRVEDEVFSTISDRTPLDSLAYTAYQINVKWRDLPSDYYWKVSEGLVEKHMQEYDKLFYFPVYWPPVEDGSRDPDTGYQKDIDSYIATLVELMGLKVIEMPDAPIKSRIEFVKRHIFN